MLYFIWRIKTHTPHLPKVFRAKQVQNRLSSTHLVTPEAQHKGEFKAERGGTKYKRPFCKEKGHPAEADTSGLVICFWINFKRLVESTQDI